MYDFNHTGVNVMTEEVKVGLEPNELFDYIKKSRIVWDTTQIEKDVKVLIRKMQKAKLLFQKKLLKKLKLKAEILLKERVLVENGITKVVNGKDLKIFIDKLKDDHQEHIALIELERYMREIPNEVMEDIQKALALEVFDDIVILYTDFSEEGDEKTPEEQTVIDRNKDPIAFGIFYDDTNERIFERLYYITDWVDEYCDLTMDKYMDTMLKYDPKYENVDITNIEDSIKEMMEDKKEETYFTVDAGSTSTNTLTRISNV